MSVESILSLVIYVSGLVGVILRMEVAIAVLKEKTRANEQNISQLVKDNKQEHHDILDKLDKILLTFTPK